MEVGALCREDNVPDRMEEIFTSYKHKLMYIRATGTDLHAFHMNRVRGNEPALDDAFVVAACLSSEVKQLIMVS